MSAALLTAITFLGAPAMAQEASAISASPRLEAIVAIAPALRAQRAGQLELERTLWPWTRPASAWVGSGRDFDEILASVEVEELDAGRLRTVRELQGDAWLTSAEVAALAAACTFDATREQVLLALYPTVRDPDQFDTALDQLEFSPARRRVERAMGR